jgi:hypothetical protein
MKVNLCKSGALVCLCFVVLLGLQVSVVAHPPSDVSMSYDEVSGVLSVLVMHDSDDLTLHNINQLIIWKNDQVMENVTSFIWEEDEEKLVATYNISAIDGDKIEVEARCSISGSLLGSIVVGGTGGDESTPGFEVIIVVAAVLVFIGFRKQGVSNT